MNARSLDDVVVRLDDIIDDAKRHASRLGYFAALYRKLTWAVRTGIAERFFEDGDRMERIGVCFANRYFDAYDRHRRGDPPTAAWRRAFEACGRWRPIATQHLVLGMNAHINLDLGIAVAETVTPAELPATRADFNRINELLSGLLDAVQLELAALWPAYRLLDWATGRTDECVIDFSLTVARDKAWATAEHLASLSEADRARAIAALDVRVDRLARVVLRPSLLIGILLLVVRLGERRSIAETLEILE